MAATRVTLHVAACARFRGRIEAPLPSLDDRRYAWAGGHAEFVVDALPAAFIAH